MSFCSIEAIYRSKRKLSMDHSRKPLTDLLDHGWTLQCNFSQGIISRLNHSHAFFIGNAFSQLSLSVA